MTIEPGMNQDLGIRIKNVYLVVPAQTPHNLVATISHFCLSPFANSA